MHVITDIGKLNIINLTSHKITVLDNRGNEIFELSGVQNPPRVEEIKYETKHLKINGMHDLKIYKAENVSVTRLPQQKENTYYIVSRLVAEYAKKRKDLLVPDEFVRDEDGNIIGCKSFKNIV